jgi:hypothetical protein
LQSSQECKAHTIPQKKYCWASAPINSHACFRVRFKLVNQFIFLRFVCQAIFACKFWLLVA